MWLITRRGSAAGRSVEITGERFLVGRVEDCHLRLDDDNVSRWHAYFEALPDGRARLNDLDSANGTFVNGQRIDGPTLLEGGEQLQFGDSVLVTSRHEPSPERATTAGAGPPAGLSAIRRAIRSDSLITAAMAAPGRARRTAVVVTLVTVSATVGALFALGLIGRQGPSAEDAVAKVAPSVALVETLDRGGARSGTGTAFVVDAEEGLAVTNAHVVNEGARFRLAIAGQPREAKIVGSAPCEDLALLQVSDTRGLEEVQLGSQSDLRRGQTVVAVGYPGNASLEDELTSTEGVVSVVRTSFRESSLDVPQYTNVIQTDAAINPGNSGGPLVDLQGRLAGVNAAGRTMAEDGRVIQGQGYAIGVDRLRTVLEALRRGRSTAWAGIGFDYPTADTLADLGIPAGLRIAHVVPGTPAAELDLEDGRSYVVEVDGKPVDNSLAGWCAAAGRIVSGQTARLGLARADSPRLRRVSVRFP